MRWQRKCRFYFLPFDFRFDGPVFFIGKPLSIFAPVVKTVLQTLSFIKKLWTVSLLVLCFAGSLPKSYFHDLVANHTDEVVCSHPDEQTDCVHPQGYHCGFTDLVVTAPYLPVTQTFALLKAPAYPVFTFAYACELLSNSLLSVESRGPPPAA